MATYIPGYHYMRPTGGTGSARYCYAVWLRHLILANKYHPETGIPGTVAELGPGDSIGIGLAALLTGAEKYDALDIVRYSNPTSNLDVFDELVSMFQKREAIPGDNEFPLMNPKLDSYEFPFYLIDEESLTAALEPTRVANIRSSIEKPDGKHARIRYHAPWTDSTLIQKESVDMIYSQAVLEHVDDLAQVSGAMRQWVKPTAVMTHQIDYGCHGKADTWNGYWAYSDLIWKVIVGRRPYLLNRVPHSVHKRYLREQGFDIIGEQVVSTESTLRRGQLALRFRDLSQQDLTTSGAFLVATVSDSDHRNL